MVAHESQTISEIAISFSSLTSSFFNK